MTGTVRTSFLQRMCHHKVGIFGLTILAGLIFCALLAPVFAPHSPVDTNLSAIRQFPQPGHWLGTDELGRDVLSRLLYGARVSLLVGISSVILSTTIGLGYGVISGYAGGFVDNIMMRIVDGLLSIPTIVLVISIQSIGEQSLISVVSVIALTNWMQTSRLVRTEFISVKQRPFVKAAAIGGASDMKLVFRHILPNCMASVIVLATINVGHAITTEAALSFLGLGIPPHLPSWGNMLIGGQRSILAGCWWITLFPGLMIVVTVLALNFVGDAVRDAIDPLSAKTQRIN